MNEQQQQQGGRLRQDCLGMLRECVPDKAREHFRNSRLEFLKGLRTFIDHRIEHLSRGAQKGSSVPVE